MQYNARTARLIEAWFSVTGVPPIFLRVIRTLYRAAWRQNHVMVGCCDKPLAWIREARSAHWWTTCCALGRSARHRSGIVQQSSGHRVMWEDVFVEFLGLDWRQTRSTCTTYSDWRAGEASFVQRVCSEWGLPWKPDQTTPSFLDPLSNEVPKSLNTMPAWHDHPEDVAWKSPRGCIQFIIDNQVLAMLMSGTVPLL